MTLHIAPSVAEALAAGAPVVALESTIITHGMPWPRNVAVARAVEAAVRAEGAVPATIAVLDGRIRVGLDEEELVALAKATDVLKLSDAELAFAMASGRTGSTTVAATCKVCALAGIRTFATGGIGGVHRGAERTRDVSADLRALGTYPVTVVCAGPKAVLDVAGTLEELETRGVPVVALGTNVLPTFWSRDGRHAAPLRLETEDQVAAMRAAMDELGASGLLVAVPVPEAHAIASAEIDAHIEAALREAADVRGKDVTPFLLSRVLASTKGRSLETNAALIENNARVAARVAVALAGRNRRPLRRPSPAHPPGSP